MSRYIVINGVAAEFSADQIAELEAVARGHEFAFKPDNQWMARHILEIVAVSGSLPQDLIEHAVNLRWVQSLFAGGERIIDAYSSRPEIVLSVASGVAAIPIAEHLLAMALAFARMIHLSIRQSVEKKWDRSIGDSSFEIFGKHVLVVGAGSIGSAFSQRAAALGMRVTAIRRNPERSVSGAERTASPSELGSLLPQADFVVNTLPYTLLTASVFGEEQFGLMRRSAYFLNSGRGKTVDEPALVKALSSGAIAGAGLDVFDQEPLPADSPLWDMENVIITPHISFLTPEYSSRLFEIVRENLGRFCRGDDLINVIDRDAGY